MNKKINGYAKMASMNVQKTIYINFYEDVKISHIMLGAISRDQTTYV